jgi:hypothetical protein
MELHKLVVHAKYGSEECKASVMLKHDFFVWTTDPVEVSGIVWPKVKRELTAKLDALFGHHNYHITKFRLEVDYDGMPAYQNIKWK